MRAHFTFSDPTFYVDAFYAFKFDLQSFFTLNFPLGFKKYFAFLEYGNSLRDIIKLLKKVCMYKIREFLNTSKYLMFLF